MLTHERDMLTYVQYVNVYISTYTLEQPYKGQPHRFKQPSRRLDYPTNRLNGLNNTSENAPNSTSYRGYNTQQLNCPPPYNLGGNDRQPRSIEYPPSKPQWATPLTAMVLIPTQKRHERQANTPITRSMLLRTSSSSLNLLSTATPPSKQPCFTPTTTEMIYLDTGSTTILIDRKLVNSEATVKSTPHITGHKAFQKVRLRPDSGIAYSHTRRQVIHLYPSYPSLSSRQQRELLNSPQADINFSTLINKQSYASPA